MARARTTSVLANDDNNAVEADVQAVQAGLVAPGSLEAQQRLIKDESKFK